MDKLTALDAGFVELEDANIAIHIGAAAVFEGPPPSTAEAIARYEHLVLAHPRYRQVLSRAPLDVRRPRWRDAGHVDLGYHVRRTALPSPGARRQLEDLMGLVMSGRLDPDRPLWEAWIVEDLADGHWAVITKVHHSLVDGVGGMATLLDLLDPVGDEAGLAALPVTSVAAGVPALLSGAWRRLSDVRRHPLGASASLARTAISLSKAASLLRLAAPSSLNGTITRDRYYRTLTVERADIETVRRALGGTVNDVVLTLVARGFHDLLLARGEQPVNRAVRCLVPMNVRGRSELKSESNKITFGLVDLPTAFAEPLDTYLSMRSRINEVKGSSVAGIVAGAFALADLVPSPIASAALAGFRRIPQRIVTTITTNVPGPQGDHALFGRRLVALYPYVPIADHIRVAIAVTSSGDKYHFGLTCDRRAIRNPDVFVNAMATALSELTKQAEGMNS